VRDAYSPHAARAWSSLILWTVCRVRPVSLAIRAIPTASWLSMSRTWVSWAREKLALRTTLRARYRPAERP
jgi:hypothetical protein